MKPFRKKSRHPRRLKDTLLRSFLIISIICCVFLVSNCDQLFDLFGPGNGGGTTNPPGLGSSESGNLAADLLKSVGEGAAGEVGGAAASWALGAIGLGTESGTANYDAQLNAINQDLNKIINQLNGIQAELNKINTSVQALNCSDWQINVSNDVSSVYATLKNYNDLVTFASDTSHKVKISDIQDVVDEVLAQGAYATSNNISMEKVLADFETDMILPGASGVLPACLQYITSATTTPEHSFAEDTVYYDAVNKLTDYYYYYETEALFLYSEAEHFLAWKDAGMPNVSDTSAYLSADSVSYVCTNTNANKHCFNVVSQTNSLYNSLVQQFTITGAPYTDDNFVLEYRSQASGPILWPKSLEDFTVAAGNNCTDPLTSGNPCGITAGFYDQQNIDSVNYRGYSGWQTAGSAALQQLLAGWTSNAGTAGNYLQNKFSFKNMKNKVIISSNTIEISLNETYASQYVVPFFDTDWDYNFIGGGPALTEIQFRNGPLTKSRTQGGLCAGLVYYYESIDYKTNSSVPSNRNSFYNASGHARVCQNGDLTTQFSWSVIPGYVGYQVEFINSNWTNVPNHESSAKQFRWPVLFLSNIPCSYGNSKNAGGYWTMCGQNFIDYLNTTVPKPQSCDNTSYPCYPPTAAD